MISATQSAKKPDLRECPFCGHLLTVRGGVNPYGRCDTLGCWMHDRMLSVACDDPKQVASWNRRAALSKAVRS